MITDSEFLQAAVVMSKYCKNKVDVECDGCPFSINSVSCGAEEDVPAQWALPPDAQDVECEEKESGCLFSKSCKDCRFVGIDLCPDLWRQERELKQEQESKEDNINHPAHYCMGGIECIDAIKAATGEGFTGYLTGNIIKYLFRYQYKGGIEDLKKARWYLNKLIECEGRSGV